MFSLFFGLWEYIFKVPSLHILIIGLDYAGKSSLLERIKAIFGPKNAHTIPMERIPPTIGMNIAKIKYRGAQVVFWDLGGQSKMRAMWERYYNSANAVIFVVDSTDAERLGEARLEFESICKHDQLRRIPILIFANKQDLADALTPLYIADALQGSQDISKAFSISALSGVGIEHAISYAVSEARIHAES